MTFKMTITGMPSNMPHSPHNQEKKMSAIKTAAAFILAMRPVIQVVINTPTTVAIKIDAPETNSAINIELNCMYAAMPVAAAVATGPK